MKGDFSRLTFNPKKQFSRVLWQQGKVQLDSELNEQQAIQQYLNMVQTRDVIGWSGVPINGGGFKIGVTDDHTDLTISPGRFYVDGLLVIAEAESCHIVDITSWIPGESIDSVVLETTILDGKQLKEDEWIEVFIDDHFSKIVKIEKVAVDTITFASGPIILTPNFTLSEAIPAVRRVHTYSDQPFYPQLKPISSLKSGNYLVYLDVWERFISAIDDPDIREKALGGIETTCRSKLIWQVKLLRIGKDPDCSDFGPDWTPLPPAGGSINARTAPAPEVVSDCLLPPQSGYQGLENQLYRVEIHQGGLLEKGGVTFKWSRENGSVVTPVQKIDGSTITVESLGPDEVKGFAVHQWVELQHDVDELQGLPGIMCTIGEVLDAHTITITEQPEQIDPIALHAKLRRWEGSGEIQAEIPQENDGWIKLENEIEIKFSEGHYSTGDYWLIPARSGRCSALGTIEWPHDDNAKPLPQLPHGISHHYAPLAIISLLDGQFDNALPTDCRNQFLPLIDLPGSGQTCMTHCCTLTVGDGRISRGDFNDLQEALDNMPEQGGCICVLPGNHYACVKSTGCENIHIKGCGIHSKIYPSLHDSSQPIFAFSSCHNITLEHLTLITLTGTAIEVKDVEDTPTSGLFIERNTILGYTHAIDIRVANQQAGNNTIRIRNNEIGIWDLEDGGVAVFCSADDVVIEDNRIVVIPPVNQENKIDPRVPDGPEDVIFDPCADRTILYTSPDLMSRLALSTQDYLRTALAALQTGYNARGGMQFDGGSEHVRITANTVVGGTGNGVTLGALPEENFIDPRSNEYLDTAHLNDRQRSSLEKGLDPFLYEIIVADNTITNMGLSGVGMVTFIDPEEVGLMICLEDSSITDNVITHCANQINFTSDKSIQIGYGGISLACCENVAISNNRIEDNGQGCNQPICGIFIQYGELVNISDNRIINNGPQRTTTSLPSWARHGGIVITMVIQPATPAITGNTVASLRNGISALKIHGNIIVQPKGQALMVMALGPLSIVGNQFTSQGVGRLSTNSAYGQSTLPCGVITIINLGVSQNLLETLPVDHPLSQLWSLQNMTSSGMESKYQTLPNGNVLFADNQITLDMQPTDRNIFSAQLIATLDDVSYTNNQSNCTCLYSDAREETAGSLKMGTNGIILGATSRINNNRFHEGMNNTEISVISIGLANTTTENQATHCILVFGYINFSHKKSNTMYLHNNKENICAKIAENYLPILTEHQTNKWGMIE
ncbi:DUF6519 domain-containing protein [Desulfogranum japonicum]|uniref:DUF6519 domain-containing protein n=1 Tax=Desulfogranum japonicum TaxID=231447 RepID=UPI0003FA1E8A|nr:DUF6519 domain-containing protein [Desulfogranum japonicum]